MQFPPFQTHPLSSNSKFALPWQTWFRSISEILDGLIAQAPVGATFSGSYAGGGTAKTLSISVSPNTESTLYFHASALQTWITAAPTWTLSLKVDGVAAYTTGARAHWQDLASVSGSVVLLAGAHTITLEWSAGSANATLEKFDLVVMTV